jgi:hypothetical protein
MQKIYYIVEIMSVLDGINYNVLCSEENLSNFLAHLDKDNYQLVNVYGVGQMYLETKEFVKKDNNLEHGS